jgi:hypothetical protein
MRNEFFKYHIRRILKSSIKACQACDFTFVRLMRTLFIVMTIAIGCHAQSWADSVVIRPVMVKSPRGAMLRSLTMPGWGQAYNGKWFKAILVLGAESGLAANAVYYNRKALNSGSEDEKLFYQDSRSAFIWWFAGIYMINILDAYVDAQLFSFDVSPDLKSDESPGGGIKAGIQISFYYPRQK